MGRWNGIGYDSSDDGGLETEARGRGDLGSDFPTPQREMPRLRPDRGIVQQLLPSYKLSSEFVRDRKKHLYREKARGLRGGCQHRHLQEWHGAEEPLRCQFCCAPISDFGWDAHRIEEERALAQAAADEDKKYTAEENAGRCHSRGVSVAFLVALR